MKKLFTLILAAGLLLSLVPAAYAAHTRPGASETVCSNWADADQDGICDNHSTDKAGVCDNRTDADKDGMCDNRIDADKDGGCDNRTDADQNGICDTRPSHKTHPPRSHGRQNSRHHGGHHGRR